MQSAPPWPKTLRSPIFPLFAGAIIGATAFHLSGISWMVWTVPSLVFLLHRRWQFVAISTSMALGGYNLESAWSAVSAPEWEGTGSFHCEATALPITRYSGWQWTVTCRGAEDTRVVRLEGEGLPPNCVGNFRIWARWEPWRKSLDFDEVSMYTASGIAGRLKAVTGPEWLEAKDPESRPLKAWIHAKRMQLRHVLACNFTTSTYGFLWGISTGDKSEMDHRTRESFAALGLSHVLAVSGYHVGLVGCIPLLFARSRNKWFRKLGLLGIPFIGLYVMFCGSGDSAMRAWCMTSLILIGSVLNRNLPLLHSLALTGWWMMLVSPLSMLKLGTQLSFLAVGGIALGMAAVQRASNRRWVQAAVLPFSAQAATAVLTVPTFRQFPLAFLPVNWVAGPWISWLGMTYMVWLVCPASWSAFGWLTEGIEFQVAKMLWLVAKLAQTKSLCAHIQNGAVFAWVLGCLGLACGAISWIRPGKAFWLACTAVSWACIPWTIQSEPTHDWVLGRSKQPSIQIDEFSISWKENGVMLNGAWIDMPKHVSNHWSTLPEGYCYFQLDPKSSKVYGLGKKGPWEFRWNPITGLGSLSIAGHHWVWEQWHEHIQGRWPLVIKKGAEAPGGEVNSDEATASSLGLHILPILVHQQSEVWH